MLQGMLEGWWDEGWARFMGRAPQPDDLIFPREDGKHRLVSGTYKQFNQDLATLGLAIQRQYESRSTFRNLALSAGAAEFHVNLITRPKPKRASDYYTRLEMQWPGMCEAILAIDAGAWDGAARGEVTVEVTSRVTAGAATNEKPPVPLVETGGQMEREKGFESRASPDSTGTYVTIENAPRGSTRPPDASVQGSRETVGGDSVDGRPVLPTMTPELFISAGALVAGMPASREASRPCIECILRLAVDQAAALYGDKR